ncbi:MAG: DNA repair protein RecO [Armatimonadetes bacterium]|nr:DNA repair protein RecO [Armatimonadota bacterium]
MSTRAITVHAVVLRRHDLGESDRRLTLLTEELGVFDAIAKGARKGGSRLAGASEPLSVSALHLAIGKRQWYVTQAQAITSYPGLRLDYERLSFALALCEIASWIFPHEQPAPEAFRFFVESVKYLEVHPEPLAAAVWAEVRMLELAGFGPQFVSCVACGRQLSGVEGVLSPKAGGLVCPEHEEGHHDTFRVRAEAAIGLERIGELDAPPEHFRFGGEAYRALLPFWLHVVERALPARQAATH